MPAGAPEKYSKKYLDRTVQYINKLPKGELLPTIEGLAIHLDISRKTIYNWCEDHPEFLHIIDKLMSSQGRSLIMGGLSEVYNSTITKLLLTKHGYSDRQELTGRDGEKIELGVVILPKKNENSMGTTTEAGASS